MRFGGAVVMLALVAVLSAGCGDDESAGAADRSWQTSTDPVPTDGLAWASGSTVHLPDGTTVETGEPVGAFVVAGDGVFFEPGPAEEADATGFSGGDLRYVEPGGEPVDTGLVAPRDSVVASPDGRYLVVLETDGDDGSGVLRLWDLSSGEAYTSEDGMDTSGVQDPVDHLLEMEVQVLGIDDEQVLARVLGGDYAYDLDTGEGRPADEQAPEAGDPLVSPTGGWRIVQGEALRDAVVSPDGARVRLRPGTARWTLSRWLDDQTVVGVAIDGPGTGADLGPADRLTLMTCQVPSGACEPVPGTTGERVVLPTAPGAPGPLDLRTRTGVS